MSKIKVAFFADCLIENYDGAVRTMYQIINQIPTNRFEFLFITGDKPLGDFEHQILEVPSVRLPMNHNYKMTLSFMARKRLQDALDQFNPDVIHISTPSPLGHFALNYGTIRQIPILSIYHTHFLSYVDYYFESIPILIKSARKYMMGILRSFYNQCDLLYVPTQLIKNELQQIGVFTHHQVIWKRGLKVDQFSPSKRNPKMLDQITKNQNPNILFCSRLVWEKNLRTLIKIYRKAEKLGLAYNFIIAGEGYARRTMEHEMPNAYFLGNLDHDELSTLYASSDVFLFPSISETYGNVIPEAMASGLPCVIANGGGTVEFISDGVNGFLCTPNDPMHYLSNIRKILEDEKLKYQFIANGLAVTHSLRWNVLTQKYFQDILFLAKSASRKTA